MDKMKNSNDSTVYPDFIRDLPEADIPVKGIRGWLLGDGRRQALFMDIMPEAIVPPHSHCAQWGIMVKGEMDLTIKGVAKRIRPGDNYFIPEGAEHSAKFHSHVTVIDIFDAPDRYKAKK